MKTFVVGLTVIIPGNPRFQWRFLTHKIPHGIKAGDVSSGVQTHGNEKSRACGSQPPSFSGGWSWTDDRQPG